TLFVKNIKNNNNFIFLSPPLRKRGSGGVLLSFFLHRWNTNTPLSPLQKRGNFTISPSSKEGKLLQLPLFVRGGRGVFFSPLFCTNGIRTPLYPLFVRGEILYLRDNTEVIEALQWRNVAILSRM
ncbi:hypothetical protein LLG34_07875, partial [bacterium]|nr:hypothetical protein [bacterium]